MVKEMPYQGGNPRLLVTVTRLIYPDGREEHVNHGEWPRDPGLAKIRSVVLPMLGQFRPGANMEHVHVLYNGIPCSMFVDEFSARRGMPLNQKATNIYWNARLRREPGADTTDWNRIYGPAILFNRFVWF